MELEEFIKKTLVSIYRGIHGANKEVLKLIDDTSGSDTRPRFLIDAHNRNNKEGYISFDVAVTVSSEIAKAGGAGIRVAGISLGGEKTDTGIQEHISRIKFNILPSVIIS